MTTKTIRKGRLNGKLRMRLIGLLDMEYKPAELAAEVGFSRKQIYRIYRKFPGFPCRVDETKHLWINGADFRNWYHRTYPKIEINSDEAFCVICHAGVKIVNPTYHTKGTLHYLLCHCPDCGRKISKMLKNNAKGNEQ